LKAGPRVWAATSSFPNSTSAILNVLRLVAHPLKSYSSRLRLLRLILPGFQYQGPTAQILPQGLIQKISACCAFGASYTRYRQKLQFRLQIFETRVYLPSEQSKQNLILQLINHGSGDTLALFLTQLATRVFVHRGLK
jgi:hypothetical protein